MEAPSPSPSRLAFAGMIALAVAMGIGRFVYTPILPGMMEELGLSPADAGWIASANYLGYLVGALAAAGGWAHGRERMLMLAGLGASTILAGLMGMAETMAAFLAIRFLAGLASAFVMVFMASIVFGHLAAANRNDLQALHFGGVGLGIVASSAMMAILVTEHAGWPAGWFWSSVISACGFAIVALLLGSTSTANGIAGREQALPKDRSLIKDHRRLRPVRLRLYGDGDIPGRHRPPGRWRPRLRSHRLDGHRPCRFSLGLALAKDRGEGSGSIRPTCRVASSRRSASPPASPWADASVRCSAGFCSAAPSSPSLRSACRSRRLLAPQAPRRVFAVMTASFGFGQIIGPIVAGLLAQASGDFFLASIVAAVVLLVSGVITWSAAPKSP